MSKKEKMENKKLNSSEQLVISYELLQLMQWIVEHESESLKKIINRALKNGFDEQLTKSQNYKELYSGDDMQNNIIDFLSLWEILLYEATNESDANRIIQKNLVPAIDHVDKKNCDSSTLKSSIDFASSKINRKPEESAQEIFLKELLKRWKPNKNHTVN